MSFDFDIYKNYVKYVLGRAAADENYEKHNKESVFYAKEISGYISIAEFGHEQAQKFAMRVLENWFYTGEGRGGKSKIRKNYWLDKLIARVMRPEMFKPKPKPTQGELFPEYKPLLNKEQ
jgi:hypothetical protein